MSDLPIPAEGILLTHFVVSADVPRSVAFYDTWRSRGAAFLTPPQDLGPEIRCHLRDPDGHLIEVGQTLAR